MVAKEDMIQEMSENLRIEIWISNLSIIGQSTRKGIKLRVVDVDLI
ncbi:MAG: hypothetical protein ACKO96_22285 [Flammeovirgaceae bacterium]